MRFYLLSVLLTIALSVCAAEKLALVQSSGETSWAISTVKDVTFDGNGVKITFTDATSVYSAKADFKLLKFDTSTSSAIDNINADGGFSINGNTITAEGEIKVYSLAGELVAQGKDVLSIENLSDGAYIVKAGSQITKIVKQ